MSEEKWLWVDGYEGLYMVSDQGRVMSVPRKTGRNSWPGRTMRQGKGNSGYLHVCLCVKSKAKTREVHRLVAEAFLERPHGKTEVNHIDGNKTNNAASNLEWVTRSENVLHAYQHIERKSCDHFHPVKLTEDDVREILSSDGTNTEIAKKFGVSDVTVGNIKNGKTWRHLSCQSIECA